MNQPRRVGDGASTFSTSVSLVRFYPLIWDTNNYYRELGVSPYAYKKEIKKAYQKKRGWKSPRLTYIFKQLLDPEIRRRYDATPLGSIFIDKYVEAALRRQRMAEVSEMRREGHGDLAEALSEAPLDWDWESDWESEGGFDNERSDDIIEVWPFSFYQWNTVAKDILRLELWQHLLISAFNGRSYQLSVGFVGHSPLEVAVVGYNVVAFLGEAEWPTDKLAQEASRRVESTINIGGKS